MSIDFTVPLIIIGFINTLILLFCPKFWDSTNFNVVNEITKPQLEPGALIMFIGPMFSRKTTRLIHELCTYADIGLSTMYINHALDIRSENAADNVTTHSSQFRGLSDKITSVKVTNLSQVKVDNFKVIGVDESNFFDDLFEVIVEWVEHQHKIVFVAGLAGDIFNRPIGHTLELIPYADSVVKLTAFCKQCLTQRPRLVDAPFTARLSSSKEQVMVGGSELYLPLCRKCHIRHNQQYQT